MHQPYYKRLKDGIYQMPWVRLHGLKDYYDMVAILKGYPSIHQTFNLVPSLIEQLLDYGEKNAYDLHLYLTEKEASQLSSEEKQQILSTFFNGNLKTMISPYLRFCQLWEKRGKDIKTAVSEYCTQDFLDLQIWSNLAWIDPIFRGDPEIGYFFKKEQNFTEDDKKLLILKQRQILKGILPEYKNLKEKGQIEITFSPYFHPIMPLILDTCSAEFATPEIQLPQKKFSYPEDLEAQIERGMELYHKAFGDNPQGLWPPEGAVSEGILPLLSKYGLRWIASDQQILLLSLPDPKKGSKDLSSRAWFFPYKVKDSELAIVFRDNFLSDLLSFVYRSWNPEDAANDFIKNLHNIRDKIGEDNLPKSLISVILDGENCWEYYTNDGHDFLNLLYQKIEEDPLIKTVKIGEFLAKNPPQVTLSRLWAGSWINRDFRIWIGHPEDNLAWDLLRMTRDCVVGYEKKSEGIDKEKLSLAWKEIYIAEGSDWCWWYGDEHQGPSNEDFDRLFRSHLVNAYELLGEKPPDILFKPIRKIGLPFYIEEPTGLVTPVLDGKETHFFEWQNAGFLDCLKSGGVMHKASHLVKALYFGFDQENLYFRVDFSTEQKDYRKKDYRLDLEFTEPSLCKISIQNTKAVLYGFDQDKKEWQKLTQEIKVESDKVIELSLPLRTLEFKKAHSLWFRLVVFEKDNELERWPQTDLIKFNLPWDKKKPMFWGV